MKNIWPEDYAFVATRTTLDNTFTAVSLGRLSSLSSSWGRPRQTAVACDTCRWWHRAADTEGESAFGGATLGRVVDGDGVVDAEG